MELRRKTELREVEERRRTKADRYVFDQCLNHI